jgi:hypothetical protein
MEDKRAGDGSAARPGCDFCTPDQRASWRYPCQDFANVTEFVGIDTWELDTRVVNLTGDWFACSACRDLIEANRWDGVKERYLDAAKARVPDGIAADVWGHLVDMELAYAGEKMLEGFRANRKPGPPEPVRDRDRPAPGNPEPTPWPEPCGMWNPAEHDDAERDL